MISKKGYAGNFEELIKILLWIIFFIIALGAIWFLFKGLR